LLLIPLAIDEMFDRLKIFLRATNASTASRDSTQQGKGQTPSSRLDCKGTSCHSRVNPTPGFGAGGFANGIGIGQTGSSGSHGGGSNLSGLEALAMMERQQLDAFNSLVRSRYGRRRGEVWVPIEPGPSNPSRFFPELPKPRLSSGVALSTGPDERRAPEKLGVNNWGRGEPTNEAVRPNTWGQGSPVAEERRENTWGRGTPVMEERRENTWGEGTVQKAPPVVNRQLPPPLFVPPFPAPAAEPEAPRIVFQAPPKARPTEQARTEKLIEVCGRLVPMSQAPTVSLECAPQPAPEPKRKPASEEMDEGGNQKLFMP